MNTFKIKKGDKNPALSVTLQYNDGTAVNLYMGSVYFIMANKDYTPYMSGLCILTGSETGNCEYRWQGGSDTGSVGTYWGEFECQWNAGGSKMTLPTDHSLQIQIYEDYN